MHLVTEKRRAIVNIKNSDSKKKKKFLNTLVKDASVFCVNTTLHGYKFITGSKKTLLEK